MTEIRIKAPAKINLWLDVKEKRPDNYHEIESIMQSVSLYDEITVRITDEPTITLRGNSKNIPYDERNIAYKAARTLLYKNCHINNGVDIYINKSIPIGAGLAGGSADAAAVLIAMNSLFGLNYSLDELCTIGKTIGADVPFCIMKGTKRISGIGDIIEDAHKVSEKHILITVGNNSVSTAEAYGMLDKYYSENKANKPINTIDDVLIKGIRNTNLFNSFEAVIEDRLTDIKTAKDIMFNCGACISMMSGSGPSVFGIFNDKDGLIKAEKQLKESNFKTFICETV